MKVIFLAYREWAQKVFPTINNHPNVNEVAYCTNQDQLDKLNINEFDLLISVGWSEELGKELTAKIECIGVHCAELDRYSYGSPIQLQIIDGINFTKHRIFSFTYDEESPRAHTHNRLYSHEVDLDLSGGMNDILEQMTVTSKVLFNMYLNDYPNISWKEWPEEELVRAKRNPIDSKLTKDDLVKMNTKELYNFFRCLEAPYPNGYIEDQEGILYNEKTMFKNKKK